jgi:drug/metabolite transporter (DMT)-like permease
MPVRFFSLIFILLWASAFVSAKYGMMNAGPFSFLFVRFMIVTGIFMTLVLLMQRCLPKGRELLLAMVAGLLMHGVYLGGVFYAISLGTPVGLASLIVSIQPIITAFLALSVLGEVIRRGQWAGIILGMAGVLLVVWPRLGGVVPPLGLVSCLVGVTAMSVGTIIQKRHLGGVDLISGNAVQALAAAGFYGVLLLMVETYQLNWTLEVTLAMVWIVLAVSLGAVSILMLLIRSGQMVITSSLFFMVPPISAVMAYLAFGETLGFLGVAGFVVASIGLWMINKTET